MGQVFKSVPSQSSQSVWLRSEPHKSDSYNRRCCPQTVLWARTLKSLRDNGYQNYLHMDSACGSNLCLAINTELCFPNVQSTKVRTLTRHNMCSLTVIVFPISWIKYYMLFYWSNAFKGGFFFTEIQTHLLGNLVRKQNTWYTLRTLRVKTQLCHLSAFCS